MGGWGGGQDTWGKEGEKEAGEGGPPGLKCWEEQSGWEGPCRGPAVGRSLASLLHSFGGVWDMPLTGCKFLST